ncbi:MAG: acetyltransferase [Actinomycetia bacterium]|nr:acetyltransferase [Actinomycetes bacterium]
MGGAVTPDELASVLHLVTDAVTAVAATDDADWSAPAASLQWSCRQTLDHTIDCVFSYGFQFAARADGAFLPFGELHSLPEAEPGDLITGLRAVGDTFLAVVRSAPEGAAASDGVYLMHADDWCARAAYEVLLHGHDVVRGLGGSFTPPAALCTAVMSSPTLWMFDRSQAVGSDPWVDLLAGSGRPVP